MHYTVRDCRRQYSTRISAWLDNDWIAPARRLIFQQFECTNLWSQLLPESVKFPLGEFLLVEKP